MRSCWCSLVELEQKAVERVDLGGGDGAADLELLHRRRGEAEVVLRVAAVVRDRVLDARGQRGMLGEHLVERCAGDVPAAELEQVLGRGVDVHDHCSAGSSTRIAVASASSADEAKAVHDRRPEVTLGGPRTARRCATRAGVTDRRRGAAPAAGISAGWPAPA